MRPPHSGFVQVGLCLAMGECGGPLVHGTNLCDAGQKSACGKSVSVVINPNPSAFESSAFPLCPWIMAFYHDVGETTRSARAPTPGGQQYQRESIASYAGTQPYWVLLGAIAPDCLYIRRSFSR